MTLSAWIESYTGGSAFFLDFFDSHFISLRLLVTADFKSFHLFKITSSYFLNWLRLNINIINDMYML